MYRTPKSLCTAIGAIMLAAVTASAVAAPSLVAPRKASLRVKDVRCPGSATLRFVVWSKKPGPVKVELERRGHGILGSDFIRADERRKGSYRGIYSGKVSLSHQGTRAIYRIVASGNGRVKKSKWVVLPCKLVI
jgi:hypothetical protein